MNEEGTSRIEEIRENIREIDRSLESVKQRLNEAFKRHDRWTVDVQMDFALKQMRRRELLGRELAFEERRARGETEEQDPWARRYS